jgi:tetratricopeptide (TPR) repeat protein
MLYGFSGMHVPGLKPQPQLAAVYLQLAFAAITNTLKQAAAAGNADREVLNALALFSTSYLFPEVQRYLPNAEAAWSSLYRQALAGTTESRRTVVEQRLRFITETRVRAGEQSAEEAARNDMQDIEKLPDACLRDRAYAQAALAHSAAKDFREARKVADRIENLEQRDAVMQFTYYDEAVSLIDSGDLIRSLESVEKVTAKEQRAVLYVRVANAALKKSDKATVLDVLNRARSLVRDADDPELQAGVLLSVGGVYVRFDASEATYVTRESIKAVNRMKQRVDETFSVVRQVGLSCVGDIRLQMSTERVEAFSFYETLGAIAKSDAQAEGALALTSEIQDKATRIRAQLAIVKAVMK